MGNQEENAGQERAFSALIDAELPRWRRVVFRILGNADDTDDAIQQALLKAWQQRDTCREPDRLSAWVCRIACNSAYDRLRERQREVRLFDEGETVAESAAPTADPELGEALETALSRLPDPLHAALNLTVFEGLSTMDAAAALGCGPATLYWRVHQARKMLNRQLKELTS